MSEHPVFYAEDEENDVFFLRRAFKTVGILNPLVCVTDGQAAIDYFKKEHQAFSLIILDLNMPRRSGIDVLDWIRKESSALQTIPVLILTSSLQESDIELAYRHGANGYLVKPSKPEGLNELARSIKDFWLVCNRTTRMRPESNRENLPG